VVLGTHRVQPIVVLSDVSDQAGVDRSVLRAWPVLSSRARARAEQGRRQRPPQPRLAPEQHPGQVTRLLRLPTVADPTAGPCGARELGHRL
jgi:hypothetical protein